MPLARAFVDICLFVYANILIDTHTQAQSGSLLSLVHLRTLKMTDDVLSVRYSPNGKLLAVSLLDSTVKVFYQDSLKFFLSLYGHKVRGTYRRGTCILTMHIPPATCTLHGCFGRFKTSCHLFRRQECQDLGARLRGLSQVDIRARRERYASGFREGLALLLDCRKGQDAKVLGWRQGTKQM